MFEKILLALDESAASERVVPAVTALAKQFHSEVIVLQVPDPPAARRGAPPVGTAASLAERIVMDLKDCGVSARPELRMEPGDEVAASIADIALYEAVDLVVIGLAEPSRHGDGADGRPCEPVSAQVLRLARRPVLTVP